MATTKIGQVIKFKNPDGTLNGGTLVDILDKQSDNVKALVNTFDDKRISIPINQLIIIKHQREGKASSAIIKRTISECKAHNKQLLEYGKNQNQEKTLEQKYQEVKEEKKNLEEQRSELLNKVSQLETISKAYDELLGKYDEALSKLHSCETGQMSEVISLKKTVESLSSCILMLNSNSEKDAFEYLLNRIKEFHNVQ